MARLLLASKSPASDIALLLSKAKAEAVTSAAPADTLALGCDSVLELDGETYGKPADDAEATARWRLMRGKTGVLHTGHWLIDERDDGDGWLYGVDGCAVCGPTTR